MGTAIGEILGNAVGVAISPIPIIAVILMLFTSKATANSLGFLLGWVMGLAVAGAIVLALDLEASEGGEPDSGGIIKIVIGALFLFLAWKQWSARPKGDAEPDAWMDGHDQ